MATIGSGQKAALIETYEAAVSLLPKDLRKQFIVLGGTSLVMLGSSRNTEDVDVAVTGTALDAFQTAAAKDSRFRKGHAEDWTYTCPTGAIKDVTIPLEFLNLGGEFAEVQAVKPQGSGFRPSLGELAKLKAKAYMSRGEDSDEQDFRFVLDEMTELAEGFEGVHLEDEDLENLQGAAKECGVKYVKLVKDLLQKAGHKV